MKRYVEATYSLQYGSPKCTLGGEYEVSSDDEIDAIWNDLFKRCYRKVHQASKTLKAKEKK